MRNLSVVIPVLNEESAIADQISHVRTAAPEAEIIVVDGGSSDRTATLARAGADEVLVVQPGRANQMNAGAERAEGAYLLFLHADTRLPENFLSLFFRWSKTAPMWGHFYLRLSGRAPVFRLIESMINLRTKLTGGATGDQCQITRADAFKLSGGFPDIPLMEDLALSRRLRRISAAKIIEAQVESSSRRWERYGILRTILLMWLLRGAFTLGVHPRHFHKLYQ